MTRPVQQIRLGRVKAVIWPAQTAQGFPRHNVTFARLYKDGDQWEESQSFGRDDLPLLTKVADQAFEWIYQHGAARPNEPESKPPTIDDGPYDVLADDPGF